jgi:hypothetical protein
MSWSKPDTRFWLDRGRANSELSWTDQDLQRCQELEGLGEALAVTLATGDGARGSVQGVTLARRSLSNRTTHT